MLGKKIEKNSRFTKGAYTISSILGLLVVIQCLLFCIKHCIFLFVTRASFSDSMATMFGMIVLSVLFILFAKKQKISLSVFPRIFSKYYILGTCIAVVLLVMTPSNYSGGFQAIILLVYGSVITPVFEELIFRGYVWNKLNTIFKKEWGTYIVTAVLFGVWHFGYFDSIAFRVELLGHTGLAKIMLMKVVIGLAFGVVLGAFRLITKNSYSTILLHGVMNIFGK